MRKLIAVVLAASLLALPATRAQWAAVLAGSPPSGYAALATQFAGDGQCWMESDAALTGAADGLKCIISMWLNFTGGNATQQVIFYPNTGRLVVQKTTGNLLRVDIQDNLGVLSVRIDQDSGKVAAITSSTGWVHLLISVDNTLAAGYAQMYINNTEAANVVTFLASGVNLDFTDVDWAVGDITGGGLPITAAVSEFYFNIATSLDMTNSANRALFIAGGKPVSLGSDGSTPTGAQPIVYFRSLFSSFTTNSGSGGNFVKKGTTAFASATPP